MESEMSEITVYNEQLQWRTIDCSVVGKYYPATEFEPAEYPELVIHKVMACDEEGNDLILNIDELGDEYDYLEKQIWEAIR
jgi:hypothetical protein